MAKIGFQFVALPAEIAELVRTVAAERKAYVVGVKHYPFAVMVIDNPHATDLLRYEELFLNTQPFKNLEAHGGIALLDANPCCLQVHMPRVEGGALPQAFVAAECDDSERLKPWKTIIARLRRRTSKGGWVVNPTTGVRVLYPSLAATGEAIRECKQRNIRIVDFLGGNELEFEEPRNAPS